ncbi:hypothetical protein [Pelagicoccus sp. SDUM812002]|uniref:hypothetical protein n=1 Tax=Pelagicoccus sp. SDUM812002 TaxID=3041266 RepID=UPI00280DE958|nr:hypothetical protein [Pelagicoccus sp. SDUM812002]MDQ8188035.1 hypothetical protein [Pelagicoccus sp. SDUM812002]
MNSRRQFLAKTATLGAFVFTLSLHGNDTKLDPLPPIPKRPPPLDPASIKAFVAAAHKDLDETRSLLEAQPSLINATWDWGGGDFETALGGAAHMGRRDIALFLLDNGARFDLFAAAMLGKLGIIKAVLETDPHLFDTSGPHGIHLISHAEKGGDTAAKTLAYLKSFKGD